MDKVDAAAKKLLGDRSEESMRQALAKLRGDWYEWLLALIALSLPFETENVPVRLPNATSFDLFDLYEPRLREKSSPKVAVNSVRVG